MMSEPKRPTMIPERNDDDDDDDDANPLFETLPTTTALFMLHR